MSLKALQLGYLDFSTENEALVFNQQIDTCMGFPTPDGRTLTWADIKCMEDGISTHYLIIITDEIIDCLTEEQKNNIIQIQDSWFNCGSITGSTENI